MSSNKCPIAFCKVSSVSEPMITCFGPCQSKFHAICLGIPIVCIEKFRDPMSGFKYICSNCRDISIGSIFEDFNRMEMNFLALRTKFLSFQRSSFEIVDGLTSDNSSKIGSSVKRNAKDMDELAVPVPKKMSTRSSTRARVQEVVVNNLINNNNNVAPISTSLGSSSATSLSTDAASSQSMAPVPTPSPIALTPTNSVGLTAVPKPASIFVSRLNPMATVEQVTDHISLNFGNCNIIKVKKLTNNRRPVSSFKIDVNRESADSLLQEDFWPDGTYVKMFENRTENTVKKRLNNRISNTNQGIRKTVTSSNVSNSKN